MRICRMTSLVSAAPGGASIPGTEMAGPPGCANGAGRRSKRSRSRPGWSLGGTICAPGGTACATAANETLTIAKAAATARTPASMPPTPRRTDGNFALKRGSEAIAGARNFSRCFNKVTPMPRRKVDKTNLYLDYYMKPWQRGEAHEIFEAIAKTLCPQVSRPIGNSAAKCAGVVPNSDGSFDLHQCSGERAVLGVF